MHFYEDNPGCWSKIANHQRLQNLGLGVLEEKHPGDEDSSDEEVKDSAGSRGPAEDTNLMDRLMGKDQTSSSEKPSIQDLGN